ncbi:MgtC/SapB family protein [Cohnella ginsengisoli]|uniref:MgtC/SapB family protein n=1 Tax=Cohnella ginsengisoli TaxID=425004 RepID=A0A9X4KES0_9BACL|nr:MgtC/SapB family protein [Cohnella ginsengisoli]MDG0790737.1 MgtC/SapB family protein [Cohnella ginsengisoli]
MEWEWLLRIAAAGLCGAIIGYERKSRMKEAGIKTHFIVGMGAALMMVLSKYGFRDQSDWENVSLDPSRIASLVVSGVGFLGAGMIILQKQTVKGLTTAAGVWSTAGMGMAIGAGLYIVGAGSALLIVLGQTLLQRTIGRIGQAAAEHIGIRLEDCEGAMEDLLAKLKALQVSLIAIQTNRDDKGGVSVDLALKLPASCDKENLLAALHGLSHVRHVEWQ